MLITHEREKLINAIIYFAKNTNYLGKTKLFKLLYFLDFGHFKQTGRSVTGLEYFAWKMGPVPVKLFEEVELPEPDMAQKIRFEEITVKGGTRSMLTIQPLADCDLSHFSKREIKLLETLATEFCDKQSDDMVEATHLENLPWHKVYNEEAKKQGKIPYEYAIRKDEKESIKEIIKEREQFVNNFKS